MNSPSQDKYVHSASSLGWERWTLANYPHSPYQTHRFTSITNSRSLSEGSDWDDGENKGGLYACP